MIGILGIDFQPINLYTLFKGLCAVLGFYIMGKLFWMCYYEWKYYEGAGEDYIKFGKKYVKKMWIELPEDEIDREEIEEKIKYE